MIKLHQQKLSENWYFFDFSISEISLTTRWSRNWNIPGNVPVSGSVCGQNDPRNRKIEKILIFWQFLLVEFYHTFSNLPRKYSSFVSAWLEKVHKTLTPKLPGGNLAPPIRNPIRKWVRTWKNRKFLFLKMLCHSDRMV